MRKHHRFEGPVAFGAVGVAFGFAIVVGTMVAIWPLVGVAALCGMRACKS